MAIINDLYKKEREKAALGGIVPEGINPYFPVSEKEEAEPTLREKKEAEQSVTQPEVKYPNKPSALNDEEYEHLLKYN